MDVEISGSIPRIDEMLNERSNGFRHVFGTKSVQHCTHHVSALAVQLYFLWRTNRVVRLITVGDRDSSYLASCEITSTVSTSSQSTKDLCVLAHFSVCLF